MSDWKEYEILRIMRLLSRGASPRPIHEYITDGEGMPWVKIADATKSNSSDYNRRYSQKMNVILSNWG